MMKEFISLTPIKYLMLSSSLSILLSGCSNTLPTASSPVHKRDVVAISTAPSSIQNPSIEMSQAEDS
ncbi:MAG: hypothetical protein AAFN08_16270, partial [Cyanobacteria bacterium J06559_3]